MRGLLASTTLLLAGSAAAAPAAYDAQKCTQASSEVTEWSVSDFDFHGSYVFTTPAHQNSWGTIKFKVSNSAVSYTAECSAASSQLQDFYYGSVDYKCKVPEANAADELSFTFDRPSGELKLKQKWYCNGEGSWFTAAGGAKVDLKCNETNTKNDKWEIGQEFSRREVSCDKVSIKVPMKEKTGVA